MPQKKSAEKALRQAQKRTQKNNIIKKEIAYFLRQFKKSIRAKDKNTAQEWMLKLNKKIDKAAEKNVFHANNAARKKSRIMKKLNELK